MSTPATKVVQLSRSEMAAHLDKNCPDMSPASRNAVLTGVPFTDASGVTYQAPVTDDGKPTHTVGALVGRKDSPEWNN